MTLNILPSAKTIFVDGDGVPLAGGSVTNYVPNTTTPKTTWQNSGATIANSNPITLDGDGGCLLWGSGAYRQIVKDVDGNIIWDQVTIDPGYSVMNSLSGTSTTSVTIGFGAKSFTTQPGLAFFPGGHLTIASAANLAVNYMTGTVTSYDIETGALVMNITNLAGSGTHTDWQLSIAGFQGVAGTVVAVSVATANGFSGTSSGGGSPQLTLATSVNGIAKGNGTALSAATSGTDYAPGTASLATGILKSTNTTGALSIAVAADFPTLNQNTTGTAANVTTNANLTGPITSVGNATSITNASITEDKLLLANNTTGNVSAAMHGFAPILPNNPNLFLNGQGNYTSPTVSLTIGTSTTSLAIGTGAKVFTTQSSLAIAAGQFLIIPSSANVANYMFGQVTSYVGTTLTMNITVVGGSGTHADWNILASGPQGTSGGGTGTINSGNAGELTYYGTTGDTVSGNSNATISSGALTLGSAGTAGTLLLSGSSSGTTTIASASAASGTLTLPAATDTLVGKATTDTLTNKTLTSPVIATIVNSGTLTLPTTTTTLVGRTTTDTLTNKTLTSPVIASISNSGTLTLPTTTDTLVGRATTDTLTNKTFDTAGTGNVLKINTTTVNAISGNTAVLATTSGSLTATHIAVFDASGNIVDGGTANGGGADVQEFTSSGTWNKPAGFSADSRVLQEVIGGGGAGGNSGTTGANGGDTTIAAWIQATGGRGGTSAGVGGAGGKGTGQHGGTGGNVNANGGSAGYSGGGGGGSGTGVGGTGVTGGLGGAGGNAGNPGTTYGGGGGGDASGGGGGGGGGYSLRWARLGDMGSTESVSIGAGGSGGARSGANGWARITVFR